MGLTLSINLVGAALKGTSAVTIGSTIDVSVQSSTHRYCCRMRWSESREVPGSRAFWRCCVAGMLR